MTKVADMATITISRQTRERVDSLEAFVAQLTTSDAFRAMVDAFKQLASVLADAFQQLAQAAKGLYETFMEWTDDAPPDPRYPGVEQGFRQHGRHVGFQVRRGQRR